MVGARRAAFRGERHQRRRVAQRPSRSRCGRSSSAGCGAIDGQRRRIDALGARAVAEHAERRGDLRLGDRGRDRVELGVGEVAQVADRRRAVARQHVERIGELARRRPWPDRRRLPTKLRSRSSASLNATSGTAKSALARPRQEVGDVGVEPDVVAARRPQAERAVRALTRQQPVDRLADALVDRGVERELRRASRAR